MTFPEIVHYTGVLPIEGDLIIRGVNVKDLLTEMENAYESLGKSIELMKQLTKKRN